MNTHIRTFLYLVISFCLLWVGQVRIANKIYPDWNKIDSSQSELSREKIFVNPLWSIYRLFEKRYNVNLQHLHYVFKSRHVKSIWEQRAFMPEHFAGDKFDIVIIGDSTAVWGLDTKTISEVSGKNVGILGFESNVLTDFTVDYYRKILPCIMKPGGIVIASWALGQQYDTVNIKRYWNQYQYSFVQSGLNECDEIHRYISMRQNVKISKKFNIRDIFRYSEWRSHINELENEISPLIPFWSAKIGLSDFYAFRIDKLGNKNANPNDLDNVTFLRSKTSSSITLLGDFKQRAMLFKVDKTRALKYWVNNMKPEVFTRNPNMAVWKKNLNRLASLNDIAHLCMLRPIQHNYRYIGVRYYTWSKWMRNTCFIDLPGLVEHELNINRLTIQSSDHVGNESGQLVSIALGRLLKILSPHSIGSKDILKKSKYVYLNN